MYNVAITKKVSVQGGFYLFLASFLKLRTK